MHQPIVEVLASTVKPPKKGHFGSRPFVLCSEVVPISEVHSYFHYIVVQCEEKLILIIVIMVRMRAR